MKAFRDTWRNGIHSYLSYLRDRLTIARELLHESGSIFVQISDENVHRVRMLMDEIFGDENFQALINFRSKSPLGAIGMANVFDYIIWYNKDKKCAKFNAIYEEQELKGEREFSFFDAGGGSIQKMTHEEILALPRNNINGVFKRSDLHSSGYGATCDYTIEFEDEKFSCGRKSWRTHPVGMQRNIKANRVFRIGKNIYYRQYYKDFPCMDMENTWTDTAAGFSEQKRYVVETNPKVIQRCLLMTTDPGDLVLDPTCGSGTTAFVAEQWGRRWVTIDTSRVALALARARLMGARFPYYVLKDSREGIKAEMRLTGRLADTNRQTFGKLRQGFVYERVPHITLKSIANNAEIDVIWKKWESEIRPLAEKVLSELGEIGKSSAPVPAALPEWKIPRELPASFDTPDLKKLHGDYWKARIGRQREIDASIAAKADSEFLYDKPVVDARKVRVSGPFTVESLSPHRVLAVGEDGAPVDVLRENAGRYGGKDFGEMILENLKIAGVQQAQKGDKIEFLELTPVPGGDWICACGLYQEGERSRKAGVFIGPEFGIVSRPDLVEAARECSELGFDTLVCCAFNYDVHASELSKLAAVPVLKARINADLHMAGELKSTSAANLFVVFGEPDIELRATGDGLWQIEIRGVDVFKPSSGQVVSSEPDDIACWFIDTAYDNESFFVRHAYFPGTRNDPYRNLQTTLKAEIDAEAWESLHRVVSRPFATPTTGRVAVKVINHLGDEVMKVVRVPAAPAAENSCAGTGSGKNNANSQKKEVCRG